VGKEVNRASNVRGGVRGYACWDAGQGKRGGELGSRASKGVTGAGRWQRVRDFGKREIYVRGQAQEERASLLGRQVTRGRAP